MIRPLLLSLLMPALAVAQDSNRFLEASASMLAWNRTSAREYFYATKREKARRDTLATTGENSRRTALHYLWQHDYEQAATWLEATADRFPKEHGEVGVIYLTYLRDPLRALRHFDAFDALTPNFEDYIGNDPVSYERGLAYRQLAEHDKAIAQFTTAIELVEKKHGWEWVNYRHYVSRATGYIALGQPEKALADLEKAARIYRQSAVVPFQRGRALAQMNRRSEALSAYQDALFFFREKRAKNGFGSSEDRANPLAESEIDEAINRLKPKP